MVYRRPVASWVAFVLVTISISTTLFALFTGDTHLFMWAHAFESLLYFYAAIAMVQVMCADDIVTLDELAPPLLYWCGVLHWRTLCASRYICKAYWRRLMQLIRVAGRSCYL